MTTHLYYSPSPNFLVISRAWLDRAIASLSTLYTRSIDYLVTVDHRDLHISQFLGNNGELFWAIHDRRTDSTFYCMTESEVLQWLAQFGDR